jgi:HEAT repeat protein
MVDPLIIVFALLGIASLAARSRRLTQRWNEQSWQEAALEAELTGLESSHDSRWPWLKGTCQGLEVRLEAYRSAGRGTRVVIGPLGHWPDEMSLQRENLETKLQKAAGRKEIVVGDPAFDDLAYVRGAPELIYAVLENETRIQLVEMLNWEPTLQVAQDQLRAQIPEAPASLEIWKPTPDIPASTLRPLIALARRLSRPADLTGRLAHNAKTDPAAGIRRASLQFLLQKHRQDPRTHETMRAALDDRDDEVRLLAAGAAGEAGYPVLEALARDAPDALAARAVVSLGRALSFESARAILDQAVGMKRPLTAKECVDSMGRTGAREAVAHLANILDTQAQDLAIAAAHALAATHDPAAENPLFSALGKAYGPIACAAAQALGRVGTPATALKLKQAANNLWPDDFALRQAIRQAIAEIHSRTGAAPGQLSLARGEAGQVSLTEDEEKHGQVSLPPGDGKS